MVIDALTEKQLEEIDKVITQQAIDGNKASVALGIPMSTEDKLLYEKYRLGYCGSASEAGLEWLKENFSKDDMSKLDIINPTDKHYYIGEGELILDPSYKQFLYKLFLKPGTGEPKNPDALEEIAEIDKLPNIFCGTTEDLIKVVAKHLESRKLNDEIENVLAFWNIKPEEIAPVLKEISEDGAACARPRASRRRPG